MLTMFAYVLVILLGQFVLRTGFGMLVIGFPIALALAWTSVGVRTKISATSAGIAGVALAVAFGYGVFRFLVGPEAFTLGPFLASTLPLLMTIWDDWFQVRRVAVARDELLRGFAHRGPEVVNLLAEETKFGHGSLVVGEITGLLLAVAWFLGK